jgi:hypothetical protein
VTRALSLGLLLLCPPAWAGGLALQPVDTPLLHDRLRIALPEGAQIDDGPQQAEILLRQGDALLFVVHVDELYETAGMDFEAVARGLDGRHAVSLPVSPPLRAVRVRRTVLGDLVELAGVYVRHPDGTALLVSFQVAADQPPASRRAFAELTGRMLLTLAAGPRTLDLAGAVHRIPLDETTELRLPAPAGVTVRLTSTYNDATGYLIQAVAPLGRPADSNCDLLVQEGPTRVRVACRGPDRWVLRSFLESARVVARSDRR